MLLGDGEEKSSDVKRSITLFSSASVSRESSSSAGLVVVVVVVEAVGVAGMREGGGLMNRFWEVVVETDAGSFGGGGGRGMKNGGCGMETEAVVGIGGGGGRFGNDESVWFGITFWFIFISF